MQEVKVTNYGVPGHCDQCAHCKAGKTTVKNSLTVQGEDMQDYRIKKICPECNKKYTEEPKQECDHIIYEDEISGQIKMSDVSKYSEWLEPYKETFKDPEHKWCFLCGAPIDWDSIKESLKQSNEKE